MTEPAELLIELIAAADVLTAEQKDFYIAELLAGRLHPDLEAHLDTFIENSVQSATQDAEAAQSDIAAIDEALAAAAQEEEAESAALLQEYEHDLSTIVTTHKEGCNAVERTFERGLEEDTRTHKDKSKEDAIRAFLKDDPSKPST